jgi:hypothetical protein
MTLLSIYPDAEQEEIKIEVRGAKQAYIRDHTPIKMRQYFTPLADKHKLADKIKKQLFDYLEGKLDENQITFNEEVAELFEVHRSNVGRYFQKRLGVITYKQREHVCRSISGRNGGRNGSSKGYRFRRQGRRGKKVKDK